VIQVAYWDLPVVAQLLKAGTGEGRRLGARPVPYSTYLGRGLPESGLLRSFKLFGPRSTGVDRACNLSNGDLGTCSSYGAWGFRPVDGAGHALQVLVVIKFTAVTPALSQIAGAASGGVIYLKQTAIGEELYF
jgi:hypothetical protein